MRSLREIYEDYALLGVYSSGREFGHLWNRSPSWYSSSICRDRKPSLEALLAAAANIDDIIVATHEAARDCDDPAEADEYRAGADDLIRFRQEIHDEVQRRIKRG